MGGRILKTHRLLIAYYSCHLTNPVPIPIALKSPNPVPIPIALKSPSMSKLFLLWTVNQEDNRIDSVCLSMCTQAKCRIEVTPEVEPLP